MAILDRMMTNICSERLNETKEFYTTLFDFIVEYESDWFVQLVSKDKKLELGIIDKSSELIPKEFQTNPKGFYITFVVNSTDELFSIAKSKKYDVVSQPINTFYGQRRLLLKDPNGTLVDISSPIKE